MKLHGIDDINFKIQAAYFLDIRQGLMELNIQFNDKPNASTMIGVIE